MGVVMKDVIKFFESNTMNIYEYLIIYYDEKWYEVVIDEYNDIDIFILNIKEEWFSIDYKFNEILIDYLGDKYVDNIKEYFLMGEHLC